VVAGLRDDAQARQLFQQLAREARALPVRDQRFDVLQLVRACLLPENDDFEASAQAPHTGGALVGAVDVVQDRDAHRATSSGSAGTARSLGRR
jgi:hypothetical protein